ncbi:serine dehydratase [Anabaena sphaerica FACHB-251]|uniref:Serine dehydratase n=1 Tax=Anabaena sphaerica FACHB-251 TaxID=2692883 RepID=A0A926WDW6_9NOST|nr:serine dehydratase [Anabaena sphaerica]MBD2292785.1 serine dehydratase [Anabaena sphaerica FACHB-251]
MQVINQSSAQNSTQVSTDSRNSEQDQSSVYTLENLIQTLEEVANYMTGK